MDPLYSYSVGIAWQFPIEISFYPYHHYIAYKNTIKLAYSVCPCDKDNNIQTLHFCEVLSGELLIVH